MKTRIFMWHSFWICAAVTIMLAMPGVLSAQESMDHADASTLSAPEHDSSSVLGTAPMHSAETDDVPDMDHGTSAGHDTAADHGTTAGHTAGATHAGAEAHGEAHDADAHGSHGPGLGEQLPLWSVIPFAGILLSIALIPLMAPTFWHHHFGKIAAGWAILLAVPYLFAFKGQGFHDLLHIMLIDYIPFIVLLWGLYTVAGGIVVRGTFKGTPMVNTVLLLIGTIIASWVGTTGAAMLLIRPLIRANKDRRHVTHSVVFFIFLVANIGGSLTPLGDPPLFLGFLHGVAFFWTTLHLLPHLLFASSILLVFYYFLDTYFYKKEDLPPPDPNELKTPIRIDGLFNVLFLGGIVGAVLMSGSAKMASVNVLGVHVELQNTLKDVIIVGMGLLSLWLTKKAYREANGFTWFPIMEVAKLFAGIFITIVPALAILQAGLNGAMAPLIAAMSEPWHFYWVTGILSSFLDNAPTYLTFFNTALGKLSMMEKAVPGMLGYKDISMVNEEFIRLLTAISCGAVFFGANTYIGNAPNFMVKSIAEENKVKMPSFFGYMAWSCCILLPLFVIVTFIFF